MSVRVALACALALVPACGLAHERGGAAPDDAAVVHVDAAAAIDAGPITSCQAFWGALSACPASPALVLGQPCPAPVTCGVHCCEPGPPIACVAGHWQPLNHMDDCSTVHCRGPHPCGAGTCAFGRVCVIPAGELGSPAPEVCVVPPAPVDSCSAAPPGSLGDDPMTCTSCTCAPGPSGDPIITLDCRCC